MPSNEVASVAQLAAENERRSSERVVRAAEENGRPGDGAAQGRRAADPMQEAARSFAHCAERGQLRSRECRLPAGARYIAEISRSRALQGFSAAETARFVFSLKQALVQTRCARAGEKVRRAGGQLWQIAQLIDELGLYTIEVFQKSREEVIVRQQHEMPSCPRRSSSCGTAFWRCR